MGLPTEEVAVPAIDQADEHLSRQPLPEPPNIDGEDEPPPQGSSNRTVRMDLRQAYYDAHVTGLRRAGYDEGYAAAKADVVMHLGDLVAALDDGDADHGQVASVPGLRFAISVVRGIKR